MELQRRYVLNALYKLNPSNGFNVEDTYETLQWFCDKTDKPTEQEFNDAVAEAKAEYEGQEYARNRASEYPPIGDQLDMIYKDMKDGTTTHAEAVEAVKTKYPKG